MVFVHHAYEQDKKTHPPCGAALAIVPAAAAASSKGTNLYLVAYSTPKPVMAKIIAAFQQTAAGPGRLVHAVLRPLDEPGEGRRRRPAGRPRLPLDGRRREPPRRRGPRRLELEPAGRTTASPPTRSSSSPSATATRSTSRAGATSSSRACRSSRRTRSARARRSGTSSPPTARERRLGKTDKQATAYVQKLFKHVVSQDTSGSNATNTFLSGKGDVLITYESEAINATPAGQEHPVRHPAADDADRAPGRGRSRTARTRTRRTSSSAS